MNFVRVCLQVQQPCVGRWTHQAVQFAVTCDLTPLEEQAKSKVSCYDLCLLLSNLVDTSIQQ